MIIRSVTTILFALSVLAQVESAPGAKALRYHLRFQIIPGHNVQRDARALADFCHRHGVEEVVLFLSVGDWNNGPLTLAEEEEWFATLKQAKAVLESAGLTVSLNVWVTVGHNDRGCRFPEGSRFKPMVSPSGEISKSCASFADPEWRRSIRQLYARFATLGFRVIWVDDDFRYHNHPPITWGGGFEPEMLDRFAQKVGKPVRRDEVVRNILKPGAPHPWRALWMQSWRECQEEFARDLAQAVAENTPCKTKMGLMNSHPSVHSIEGRDWSRLFDAFAIHGQVAHRPNFVLYQESLGKDRGHSMIMLDMQRRFQPHQCEVAPEIENYPYTHWVKSDSMTWADMALAMFYGSDALLLELFPVCGNPVNEEDAGIGQLLDKSRPALEWIGGRFSKRLPTRGVGVPWRQDASQRVHTSKGKSMHELDVPFLGAARFLLAYGVPVSAERQSVNAIFGTVAWTFDDDEIKEMLSAGLLLDAVSADILCQRGFGPQIGVDLSRWLGREESTYSMEKIASDETGVRKGFHLTLLRVPRVAVLEPRTGACEWTTIVTPKQERVGAGIVAYENRLGGRVVTFAVPDPGATPAGLPPSDQRQTIVQTAIRFLSRQPFASVMISGGPHLNPIHFSGDGRRYAVIFNGSPDPARPVVRMNAIAKGRTLATLLSPLAKPAKTAIRVRHNEKGITLTSDVPVPYLGFLVLEWEE
jgi:hypothetical protein